MNKRKGILEGKIQKGKVCIFFLESKQGCCLNFDSYRFIKKNGFCRLANKFPALKRMPICGACKIEIMSKIALSTRS